MARNQDQDIRHFNNFSLIPKPIQIGMFRTLNKLINLTSTEFVTITQRKRTKELQRLSRQKIYGFRKPGIIQN